MKPRYVLLKKISNLLADMLLPLQKKNKYFLCRMFVELYARPDLVSIHIVDLR